MNSNLKVLLLIVEWFQPNYITLFRLLYRFSIQFKDFLHVIDRVLALIVFLDQDILRLVEGTFFVSRNQVPVRPPMHDETQQSECGHDCGIAQSSTPFGFLVTRNVDFVVNICLQL